MGFNSAFKGLMTSFNLTSLYWYLLRSQIDNMIYIFRVRFVPIKNQFYSWYSWIRIFVVLYIPVDF